MKKTNIASRLRLEHKMAQNQMSYRAHTFYDYACERWPMYTFEPPREPTVIKNSVLPHILAVTVKEENEMGYNNRVGAVHFGLGFNYRVLAGGNVDGNMIDGMQKLLSVFDAMFYRLRLNLSNFDYFWKWILDIERELALNCGDVIRFQNDYNYFRTLGWDLLQAWKNYEVDKVLFYVNKLDDFLIEARFAKLAGFTSKEYKP